MQRLQEQSLTIVVWLCMAVVDRMGGHHHSMLTYKINL